MLSSKCWTCTQLFFFAILRVCRLFCSFTESGLFSHFLGEHTTALKEKMFLGVCFWDRMPKMSVWSPIPVGSAGVEWDIAALPISCSSCVCSSTAGWLLFVQHLSMPQPSRAKPHCEGFCVSCEDSFPRLSVCLSLPWIDITVFGGQTQHAWMLSHSNDKSGLSSLFAN